MRPSKNLENKIPSADRLKSLASMYERSGSQFFRITTGMQSRPDTFEESRIAMTFLIIMGVTEICGFSLVVEGKACNEIPEFSRLEFFEKFYLALSNLEDV